MNKALKVLVAIVGLFLLAACGESSVSTTSTEDGSGTSDLATASLQDRFEANQWELVDRAGFATDQVETLVTFEVMGLDDTITITLVDCGWVNIHAIEWTDGGFALTESQNPSGDYLTNDQDCRDDIQQLLIKGRSAGQFLAEISDDGTSATVTRGQRVLHLVPTGPAAEPEPAAPAETIVETTTTSLPAGDITLPGSATEFAEFFDQTEWQIVGREGFETRPIEGGVSFLTIESNPVMGLSTRPCDSTGLVAIEWNDAGFEAVMLPEDLGLATQGEDCRPPDNLFALLQVSSEDRGLNRFEVEVVDSDKVILRRGDRTLWLVPAEPLQ